MSRLPAWGQDDLPEPLPFSLRNIFRTIGPGAILLATSIGGGEWLIGPTAAVKYGTSIFWLATVAIVLQLVFNLEGMRYTLYTGEPILTGIMRLKPSSGFWGTFYIILAVLQLGVPALAKTSGAVIFAIALSRSPDDKTAGDGSMVMWMAYGVIALAVILLMSGKKVERTLELLSWGMLAYIFVFLLFVNIFFVPAEHSLHTFLGFFSFGSIPTDREGKPIDILLLVALAATAGSGGMANLLTSNWARDKGFGMGGKVGAIGGAFSGDHSQPSHVGKVFPITEENLRRWNIWWKYVSADQMWLWALGCFLGMYLNVNLATAIIPWEQADTMKGIAAGTFQADYLAQHYWSGLRILALLNGFWILFSTHLGNTDVLARTVTDIAWTSSEKVRSWKKGNISLIYYYVLALITIFACFSVGYGTGFQLFTFLAVMANVVLAISAFQIAMVNHRLLPRALQAPAWRTWLLWICGIFYTVVTISGFYSEVSARLKPAPAVQAAPPADK